MASVYNSVTNSSYSSSIQGFGGLASGLDRDSLIEGMTAATRAKIAKQQKSKQTLQWKQDAYRSISSKLIEFSKKYTSYSNTETNLFSTSFWKQGSVTPTGVNSKYVQVTGSPSSSSTVSITGVEQLAKKASVVSKDVVSNGTLTTGDISLDPKEFSTLEGERLQFKVGNKTFNVNLGSGEGYDYSDATKTVDSIKKSLEGVTVGSKKLSEMIDVVAESTDNGDPFTLNFKSIDSADNLISLAGGSEKALKALGFDSTQAFEEIDASKKIVTKDTGVAALEESKADQELFEELFLEQRIDGKNMTFTYNGVSKTIKLIYGEGLDTMAKNIEEKLAEEFGAKRIKVSVENNKLNFRTVKPVEDSDSTVSDPTSDLSIAAADKRVLEALNVKAGQSNRLNLDVSLGESGLKTFSEMPESPWDIKINGEIIGGIDANSTINEIMEAINKSKAGVTVTYMKNADRFSIVSKDEGASGKVKFSQDAAVLFGSVSDEGDVINDYGRDAIINVKYGNSSDSVTLTRGSNTFNLEGMTVTVNGTFSSDGSDPSQEVSLNPKVDSDKIVKAVSDMIKDYNAIVKLVNDEVYTKPNRNYEPLTDEQKEQMKESQIEKWEEEAKKGLLFGDSELRSLSDSLRSIFSVNGADSALLKSAGITRSTDYSDNGALVFNETEFRAALENSGDKLQELFTRKEDSSTGDRGGLATRMKAVTDQYASTTGAIKGSLIEKAGSTYAPTSILSNVLKKSMDSVDKYIERLQAQLKVETDRYVKQFTSLETVISQMNSQSSWLQGSFGG